MDGGYTVLSSTELLPDDPEERRLDPSSSSANATVFGRTTAFTLTECPRPKSAGVPRRKTAWRGGELGSVFLSLVCPPSKT